MSSQAILKVKLALSEKSLTQADVAKSLKVSQAAISKIFSGDRRPSPELARELVRVSGAPIEWHELIPPKKRSRRAA